MGEMFCLYMKLTMHAKLLQSWLTLCHLVDYRPPSSSVHGTLQARYWSGLPFPPPRNLPTQGSNPYLLYLLHWLMSSLPLEPPGQPARVIDKNFLLISQQHYFWSNAFYSSQGPSFWELLAYAPVMMTSNIDLRFYCQLWLWSQRNWHLKNKVN